MERKNLIFKIISIIFGLLCFVGLAFPFFIMCSTKYSNETSTSYNTIFSFQQWLDGLNQKSQTLWAWKLSWVLIIILFVIIATIITVILIQFFIKNHVLNKILKYTSILGIVIASALIVFFFIGCLNQFYSGELYSAAVFPHVGPMLIGISALTSSIFSLKTKQF